MDATIAGLEKLLNETVNEVVALKAKVATLGAARDKKRPSEAVHKQRGFDKLERWSGKIKEFGDWEFKLLNQIREVEGLEELMKFAKDRETMVSPEEWEKMKHESPTIDVK